MKVKLMERNQIGNYPARVGESLILFDPDKDPCGRPSWAWAK